MATLFAPRPQLTPAGLLERLQAHGLTMAALECMVAFVEAGHTGRLTLHVHEGRCKVLEHVATTRLEGE